MPRIVYKELFGTHSAGAAATTQDRRPHWEATLRAARPNLVGGAGRRSQGQRLYLKAAVAVG